MPFLLTKKNPEEMRTDAKVIGACPYRSNSRNQEWHPDLWAEQRRIEQLPPGQSMITSGMEFDAKCGIITVPPIWEGGDRKEDLRLASCYDSALRLAHRRRCRSIVFPLLAGDCHGFPKDLALRTAIATIREFLEKFDMTVYLSVREPSALRVFDKHFAPMIRQLEQTMGQEPELISPETSWPFGAPARSETAAVESARPVPMAMPRHTGVSRKLESLMAEQEENFHQHLLRLIDQKGLNDPQVYKKANLDRRLFSKIRSNANYQPSKPTALALALALELSLDETKDLLGKAGFALSRSSKSDIIVEYCIQEKIYDLYEVNQILFAFDEALIGE